MRSEKRFFLLPPFILFFSQRSKEKSGPQLRESKRASRTLWTRPRPPDNLCKFVQHCKLSIERMGSPSPPPSNAEEKICSELWNRVHTESEWHLPRHVPLRPAYQPQIVDRSICETHIHIYIHIRIQIRPEDFVPSDRREIVQVSRYYIILSRWYQGSRRISRAI